MIRTLALTCMYLAACAGVSPTVVNYAPAERSEDAIYESLRVLPVYENAELYGYLVKEIAPGSVMHRAGLREGDLILSSNGQPISSEFLGVHLLEAFIEEPELVIKVERGGRLEVLHIEFRTAA